MQKNRHYVHKLRKQTSLFAREPVPRPSVAPVASFPAMAGVGMHYSAVPSSAPAYEEYKKYTRSSWQHPPQRSPKGPRFKLSKGKKIAIVLAIVLVALLGGVLAYLHALNTALAPEAKEVESQQVKEVVVDKKPDEPFYVLVLGSDSREGSNIDSGGPSERSDVILLVRIDEKNKVVTMLSIPRDTPYYYEDNTLVRINETSNKDGISGIIKAVSEITGADISGYARLHFSGFREIVDSIGGIEMDVPVSISVSNLQTGEKVTLEPGWQLLDGEHAQALVRSRKNYEDGDVSRQRMVRDVIVTIINKILALPPTEIPSAVLAVASQVETNFNVMEIGSFAASLGADGMDGITVYSGTGPTDGSEWADGAWYCYENPEGWAAVMEVVDSGGDPSTVDSNAYAQAPNTGDDAGTAE